jgi:lysophospholipase L1-like esterase
MNLFRYKEYSPRTIPELGIVNDLGDTIPIAGTAGYSKSCVFQHISGSGLALLYVNAGTVGACDFVLEVASPNEIGDQPCLKVGCLGDSISINAGGSQTLWASDGYHYLPRLEFELDQRITVDPALVFATSGNTIPEVIIDDLPGAVASDADVIIVLCGVNTTDVSAATNIAGIQTIRDQLVNAGKTVILSTLCPSNGRSDPHKLIFEQLNEFILSYASSKANTYCVNFAVALAGQKTATTDDVTWGEDAATNPLNRDGTDNSHPSIAGYWVMADALAEIFLGFPNLPPSPRPPYNDLRFVDNPLFLGDTAGLADDLTLTNESGATAVAKVARGSGIQADALVGAWQQITVDAADTDVTLSTQITATLEDATYYDIYLEVSVKSDATRQGTAIGCMTAQDGAAITAHCRMLIDISAAGRSGIARLRFLTDSASIANIILRPGQWAGIVQYGAVWVKKVE